MLLSIYLKCASVFTIEPGTLIMLYQAYPDNPIMTYVNSVVFMWCAINTKLSKENMKQKPNEENMIEKKK